MDYDVILKVIGKANKAWMDNENVNGEVKFAVDHLDYVLRQMQKIPIFLSDNQRKEDFLASIGAIVRCALHYKLLCQNGCFDDARFFLRKAWEYFGVATSIGYDKVLYGKWKNEEFTLPRQGFSYLVKLLLASSVVPKEEKEQLKWIMGNSDIFSGHNQYNFLSNESVHGLSSRVLRAQIENGSFNLDIKHIKSETLHIKMMNVVNMILMAVNVILGVYKYTEYVKIHGVTTEAEKIRRDHIMLQEKLEKLRLSISKRELQKILNSKNLVHDISSIPDDARIDPNFELPKNQDEPLSVTYNSKSFLKENIGSINETNRRKLGRNNLCWCGSGKKYKKCHLE